MLRSLMFLVLSVLWSLAAAPSASAQATRSLRVEGSVLTLQGVVPGQFGVSQPGDTVILSCRVELSGSPGPEPGLQIYEIDPASVLISVGEEQDVALPGSTHRLGLELEGPSRTSISIGGPLASGVSMNVFGIMAPGSAFPTNELADVLGAYDQSDFSIVFMNVTGPGMLTTIMIAVENIFLGVPGPALGESYCDGALNSTGLPGRCTAYGSRVASNNDLLLFATSLPPLAFGFFILGDSETFQSFPGGSAGNLCVSGDVGRWVGPGEIQQSSVGGTFELPVDLTRLPRPNGFVPAVSGDIYYVQTWYRDVAPGGQPTSNFSNGVEIEFL